MGELGLNKIFGALLAIALVIMGLKEVSTIVFGGGHHHHKEYESLNAWAESNFKGYRVDIAEIGGAGEVIEEIYDLGALLLGADLARSAIQTATGAGRIWMPGWKTQAAMPAALAWRLRV